MAIKTERTQIHCLSDVPVAVASLDLLSHFYLFIINVPNYNVIPHEIVELIIQTN